MDEIQKTLLAEVADLHGVPAGAYNIRSNGESIDRKSTEHIEIVGKTDKSGIDIYIKPGTKNESVHIPVILSQTGLKELVYNDFHIGEDCDVTIIAGCGIHNSGDAASEHDGIHTFFVGKNAKLRYVEKHYGSGDGKGERILNPQTIVHMEEGSYMEMEAVQIKGVDSTVRETRADLAAGATLVVKEKIMTHGVQHAETKFYVDLNGEDSIIMDRATVKAIPALEANNLEASLIHEAAIGKIAGDQLIKLMTLGLTEAEAEEQIVNGFLK